MSPPESPSKPHVIPTSPIARFSAAQRRRIRAWAQRRPHWVVAFDVYPADHLDPGAHPSEAVQINLPAYLSDGFRQSHGWTLWPSVDGSRVGISFDTENGAAVVPLAEALRDISHLRVYELTERDEKEAAECVPMFFPLRPSGPTRGNMHASASTDSPEAVA